MNDGPKQPGLTAGFDYYKLVLKNLEAVRNAYIVKDLSLASILLSQTASWLLPFASDADKKTIEEEAEKLPLEVSNILASWEKANERGRSMPNPTYDFYKLWQRLHRFEKTLMQASKNLMLRVDNKGEMSIEDILKMS